MAKRGFALIATILALLCSAALSLPTPLPAVSPGDLENSTTAAPIEAQDGLATTTLQSIGVDLKNYIQDELAFEALLEQLKKEHEANLALNPDNYIADDVSIEEITRLIEEATAAPATASSVPEVSSDAPEVARTPATTPTTSTSTTTETPTTTVQTTTQNERDLECSVCLNSMKESKVSALPCDHKYHTECLTKWLQTAKVPECPLCRGEAKPSREIIHP